MYKTYCLTCLKQTPHTPDPTFVGGSGSNWKCTICGDSRYDAGTPAPDASTEEDCYFCEGPCQFSS